MSNNDIVYFFHGNSPFSQFYRCSFKEDGVGFSSAEQYMMYQKSLLFEDHESAKKILKAKTPIHCKRLGRKVKGFSEKTWIENRENIVYNGNMLKFGQNPRLKQTLLETGDSILAEASPYDRIWGIGRSEKDPVLQKNGISAWRGQNLLGKILQKVRSSFRNE